MSYIGVRFSFHEPMHPGGDPIGQGLKNLNRLNPEVVSGLGLASSPPTTKIDPLNPEAWPEQTGSTTSKGVKDEVHKPDGETVASNLISEERNPLVFGLGGYGVL